jgi:antitoxin CptB
MKDKVDIIHHYARLQWACRRGILELDILLSFFLKNAYDKLSLTEKRLFVQLLNHSDPELFSWIIEKQEPEAAELASIVALIRHHAISRFSVETT